MHGLHPELGVKGIIFALLLEVVFLGLCSVFIGLGMSEMRKRKKYLQNSLLILLGVSLAGVSLFMTKLFIEG